MTPIDAPALQRLRFLADTLALETRHPALADARLFAETFTEARARLLRPNLLLSCR